MEDMIHCKECGAYSPSISKFCIECGKKFEKEMTVEEALEKLKKEGYKITEKDENPVENKPGINITVIEKDELSQKKDDKKTGNDKEELKSVNESIATKEIIENEEVEEERDIKRYEFQPKKVKKQKKEKESIKEKKNTKKLSKEEKKEIKKRNKEDIKATKDVLLTTREILDFVDINDKGVIVMKNGYIDLFQIITKDIYSFSETDRNIHIFSFTHFIRGLVDDFKIISMKFPVNTKLQQEYTRRRIDKSKNEVYTAFLNEKLSELEYLEENVYNQEFYLMVFYKKDEDIRQKENKLGTLTNTGVNLRKMTDEKKIRILHKLNNMNCKFF